MSSPAPSPASGLERAPIEAPSGRGLGGRALRRLAAADAELSRRVSHADTPVLDAVIPRLTQSANHGTLWAGIAGVLSLGGARVRRAGMRGMLALWIASAAANGPAKALARRKRPEIEMPLTRALRRRPASSSFPSGHAASAAAFTTGVALEHPRAGLAVAPLALGVAYGRVHVGVHYTGDVVAGAALGALSALILKRVWPVRPRAAAWTRSGQVALAVRPAGLGCTVVANTDTVEAPMLETLRELAGEAEIWECGGAELEVRCREAAARAASRQGVLGVMGGDGSVRAGARAAHEAGVALWVIPGGTLNHFARELGIEDVAQAVEAVAAGCGVEVSLGRANEEVFCNTFALGVYPQLVAAREEREERIGKWPALLVALAHQLGGARPSEVVLEGRARQVWTVFAGCGRYRPAGFAPSWRARLDEGELDVRVVDGASRLARVRLIAAVCAGRLGRSRVHEAWTSPQAEIDAPSGSLEVALDGECRTLLAPVQLSVEARAVQVYHG